MIKNQDAQDADDNKRQTTQNLKRKEATDPRAEKKATD